MARNRDPFTLALGSLRERIQCGLLVGGVPIIVQDEATRLRLSPTPIREALARLSGEGLVERAASGGYVTLRLDATAVRERYAMQAHYVRIAHDMTVAALRTGRPPVPRLDPAAPLTSVDALFALIVCSAGNHILWEGFHKTVGQLRYLRGLESLLFADLSREAETLFNAYACEAGAMFADSVQRYHDRRVRAAGALAAQALTAGATRPPNM